MKAVYAGLEEDFDPAQIRSYLHICKKLQYELLYYIPVNSLAQVQVYIDFGAVKPTADFTIELLSLCPVGAAESITACQYVIGVDPDGNYYGVFTFAGTPAHHIFSLAFTFPMSDDTTKVYVTEAYELQICGEALLVEACFPDLQNNLGFDDNDIYFGLTTDEADSFGNTAVRYKHFATVRTARIFEESPKATFSSNLRRNFKTVLERNYQLKTELVPGWYKDYLQEIYTRGFIQVNNEKYRVTDLAIESLNEEDSIWKPYCKLKKETRKYFGCADETCSICCSPCEVSATATVPCESVEIDGDPELPAAVNGVPYVFSFDLTGTAPFDLSNIIKPAWMSIAVVGSNVQFSGTPDEDNDSLLVSFNINNCDGASVTFASIDYIIAYTNNEDDVDIDLRIGNFNTSPTTAIYDGFYTTDPVSGSDPVNLPAVNANVSLGVTGKIITSASCNGIPAPSLGASSVTWTGIYGKISITFTTN